MAVRNGFTKLMQKDSYKWAWESYNRHEPVHPKLFKVENSESAFEASTTGVKGNNISEKKERDPVIFSNPIEGFTVYGKNRTFADGVEFTMEMVADTPPEKLRNIMQSYASGWGEGIVIKQESFAADVFNKGGFTAGHDVFDASITGVTPSGVPTALCYDGKPFFNLSDNLRSSKGGGTYYNGMAVSLSSANLQTAYNLMTVTNSRDEADKKIALKPTALVIPPSLNFTAKTVLESEHIVGSGNNDVNVTRNLLTPIEWHYLTDTDAWFIGMPQNGIVWQNRQPMTIDFWQDETNGSYYAKVIARWGIRVENWRHWVGSNFSTS